VSGASCQRDNRLYVHPGHDDRKNMIVHELGHAIAEAANGWNDENTPTLGNPDGDCEGRGSMIQKEYAGNAANEGIAWYFAAVAFNDTTEADCEIWKSADYDHLNGPGNLVVQGGIVLLDERAPSCQGEVAEDWPVEDYIDGKCNGTLEDRGTLLDYLRAFWDADHDEGVTTNQIFAMWDAANPNGWDGSGGGLTGSDDPQERLESAASTVGVLGKWNDVDHRNGVR
jgi:hypothetical protein